LKLKVEIDSAVLREKLSMIRKSTKLGTHQIMRLKNRDGVLVPDRCINEPDEWAVVYGRISITESL
jgi:hypothetical protein